MKNLWRLILIGVSLAVAASAYGARGQADLREFEFDRVPNAQGLTGLFMTNSAFSLKAGEIRLNGMSMPVDSATPDDTIVQVPFSLSIGLSDRWEFAFVGKAISIDTETPSTKEIGSGDSQIITKWRFHSQSENMPAMAVGFGAILPTGDAKKGLNEVEDWGAKAFFLMSAELPLFDQSFLGLYLDLQSVVIDRGSSSSALKNDFVVVNVGFRIPIDDGNRLHFIGEISSIQGKTDPLVPTLLNSGDTTTFTAGIRYHRNYWNIGAATQNLKDEVTGYTDVNRYLITFGVGL